MDQQEAQRYRREKIADYIEAASNPALHPLHVAILADAVETADFFVRRAALILEGKFYA